MERDVFDIILEDLMIFYSHVLSDEQLNTWYKLLKDLPSESVVKGVETMLKTRTSSFFPTVADLRQATIPHLPPRASKVIFSEPAKLKEIILECGICKKILLYEDINSVEWGRQCDCNKAGRPSISVNIRAKKMEIAHTRKTLSEIFKENMLKSVD